MEIERKFLVKRLPENLSSYPSRKIIQGYISISPNGDEDRIRRDGDKFERTKKTGSGLVRGEVTTPLTQEQFDELWPSTLGKRVEKVRTTIPHGDLIVEVDIYEGSLAGLVIAEVEFEDEAAANVFTLPDFFEDALDVTSDKRYKNQSLAIKGIPL